MKKTPTLIFNSAPVKHERIQMLVCNLLPAQCRLETLEGREHIVVPMIMLTEGVHNGSEGAFLYNKEELAKTPVAWDHKPVVVYHPELNGQGISACNPVVINNRKVGLIMNTRFEGGKLKSEAWIEKSRANAVDDRIMNAIEKGEMMELSTGVFVDMEAASGEHNGEAYTAIARNFRPDHLALLPDKIGACSIKDGAGFLRNASKEKEGKSGLNTFQHILQKLGIVKNEMSNSNVEQSLAEVLRTKYNVDSNTGPWIWVADVYSNFVVYEYDGQLFRLGYSASDTGVTLSGDKPAVVVRVTEYRTVEGAFVGNRDQTKINEPMKKEQIVDAIIKNSEGWSETDRVALMALNEPQLTLIQNSSTKKGEVKTEPAKTETPPVVAATPAVVTNQDKKPVTLEDYIASAPAPIREVLTNSINVANEEKVKLVTEIVANKNNTFTKEDLSSRPLNELRAMARLCGSPTVTQGANYSGQAPVLMDNASVQEPLGLPVLNFSKASEKAAA